MKQEQRRKKYLDREYFTLGLAGRFFPTMGMLDEQRLQNNTELPIVEICVTIDDASCAETQLFLQSVALQSSSNWRLSAVVTSEADALVVKKLFRVFGVSSRSIRCLVVADESDRNLLLNKAAKAATSEYLAFCCEKDILSPQAVYQVTAVLAQGLPGMLYTDHAEFGFTDPETAIFCFKPDYAPDYLMSYDYIQRMVFIRRELFCDIGALDTSVGSAAMYDLFLRLTEQCEPVHLRQILYFSRASAAEDDGYEQAALRVLERHLLHKGVSAHVRPGRGVRTFHVVYDVPDQPLVSILIPNRDHVGLLDRCLTSIFEKTLYPHYEIVVIENNSQLLETFRYYESMAVSHQNLKVATYEGTFNFSSIINYGRSFATGSYLLLLNNDTEVITSEWLGEMLSLASQEGIGAVGAMLYYPDDTIQHAGVACSDIGDVWHLFWHQKRGIEGYMHRASTVQDYSAVTGACLLTSTALFDEVQGLDESFAVVFNDIDYCYRLAHLGWRTAWSPYAELYHHEGKTRADTIEDEQEKTRKQAFFLAERERFFSTHGLALTSDLYYGAHMLFHMGAYQDDGFTFGYLPAFDGDCFEDDLKTFRRNIKETFLNHVRPLKRVVPSGIWNGIRHCVFPDDLDRSAAPPLPLAYKPGAYEEGVNLYGLFTTNVGLGQGARLYGKALMESGTPHVFIDIPLSWNESVGHDERSFLPYLSCSPCYNISIMHINPDNYLQALEDFSDGEFDRHYNIGVWLWELEDIPKEWIPAFAYFDEIWVPSHFVYDAVAKVSPVPVTLIPYGIEAPVAPQCSRATFGLPEDDFLVLCMYDAFSMSARKNPQAALDAFFEAFGRDNAAAKLVLKMRDAGEEEIASIREHIGPANNVILFTKELEKEEVNSLISCCDVFMSLHRSEGFGLVMAEAMYLGVPVVTTNWSANTEFANKDVACMVDCDFVPVESYHIYHDLHARWADPNVAEAAAYLRVLFDDAEQYRHYASAGQRYIHERFSLAQSGNAMRERIDAIMQRGHESEESS